MWHCKVLNQLIRPINSLNQLIRPIDLTKSIDRLYPIRLINLIQNFTPPIGLTRNMIGRNFTLPFDLTRNMIGHQQCVHKESLFSLFLSFISIVCTNQVTFLSLFLSLITIPLIIYLSSIIYFLPFLSHQLLYFGTTYCKL